MNSSNPSLRRSKKVSDQIERFSELLHAVQSTSAVPSGDSSESRRRRDLMGALRYTDDKATPSEGNRVPRNNQPTPSASLVNSSENAKNDGSVPDDLLQRVVGRHRDRNVVTASETQHSHTGGGFLGSGKPAKDVPAFRLEQYATLLASTSDIGETAESISTANRILDAKSTVSNYLHRYEINQLKRRTLALELEEESVAAQRVVDSILLDGRERAGEMEVEVDQMERAEYNVLRHAKGLGQALGRLEDLGSDLEGIVTRVRDASAFAIAVRAKKHVGTCTVLSLPSGLTAALSETEGDADINGDKKEADTNIVHDLQMAHLARIEQRLAVRTKALVDALGIISSLSQRNKIKLQKAMEDKELRGNELIKLKAYTKALEAGPGFTAGWDWRNGAGSDALFAEEDETDKKIRGILSAALSEMGGKIAPLERSLGSSSFGAGDDFFLPLDSTSSTAYSSPIATGRRRSPSHASLYGDPRRGHGGLTSMSSTGNYGAGGAAGPSVETLNAMRQELEHSEKELKFARNEIGTWKDKCNALEKASKVHGEELAALREAHEIKIGKMSVSLAEALDQSAQYESLKRSNAVLQGELDAQRKSYDVLVAATIANHNNTSKDADANSKAIKAGISLLEEKLAETRSEYQATLAKLTSTESKLHSIAGQAAASSYSILAVLGEIQSISTRSLGSNTNTGGSLTALDVLRVHHTSQNRIFDSVLEGAKDVLRLLSPMDAREGEASPPTPGPVLAALERATEIANRPKPQYLLNPPTLPLVSTSSANAALTSSLGESVTEMERLSAARRKVLLDSLEQGNARPASATKTGSGGRADVDVVTNKNSVSGGSGLTIYIPPAGMEAWRTDLDYMESLVLRMVRMTGKHQQQHQRKASQKQESTTTAVLVAASNKKAEKKRKSTITDPSTKNATDKSNSSESQGTSNHQDSPSYLDSPPVSHCLYALSTSTYELVSLVAAPLAISIGLPLSQHRPSASSVATTPSIGNILLSTNTSMTSIATTAALGGGGMRVTLNDGTVADVADVLRVVMEDYKKEAVRLHFRCIRRRIADRLAIHRHASQVLLQVNSCRARIEEFAAATAKGATSAAAATSSTRGSALKKTVTINDGTLPRTTSGRALTQSIATTATLSAEAAAAMESTKAAVRALLRAYQKLYPPILVQGGGTLQQQLLPSSSKSSVLPSSSVAGEVMAIDLASRLKADRSAWCLASMAKDLAAKRLEQEQEQRLHLDPASEVVHPISSGAMNDEEFALMRLYGDRLALLKILVPLAPKPNTNFRRSIAKSSEFDSSFDRYGMDENDASVVLFSNSGDAFGSLFGRGDGSPLLPAMVSLSVSGKEGNTHPLTTIDPLVAAAKDPMPLGQDGCVPTISGPVHSTTTAIATVQVPSSEPAKGTSSEKMSEAQPQAVSPLLEPEKALTAIRELFREGISSYTRNLRLLHRGTSVDKVLTNPPAQSKDEEGRRKLESNADSTATSCTTKQDPFESILEVAAKLIETDVKSATQGYAKHYQHMLSGAERSKRKGPSGMNHRLLVPSTRAGSGVGTAMTTGASKVIGDQIATIPKISKNKGTQTKEMQGGNMVGFITPQPNSLSDAKTHASMETGGAEAETRSGILTVGGGTSTVAAEEEALQRATALIESWFNDDTDDGFGLGLASAGGGPYASQWEGSTVASNAGDIYKGGVRASLSPSVGPLAGNGGISNEGFKHPPSTDPNIPSFYGTHAGQPLPSQSPSEAERVLLTERVRRLEDQLKTTKIKMSEYLKELFTQKTFNFRPTAKVVQQRTVQILVSEPSRFHLTRELPLPLKINAGAITIGGAMDVNASSVSQETNQSVARGIEKRVSSATPHRAPSALSIVQRRGSYSSTEVTSPETFSPSHQISASVGVDKSMGSRVSSAAGTRPKSGAGVGLRHHLATHIRRQASPTKDRGVSCDLEDEALPKVERRLSNLE